MEPAFDWQSFQRLDNARITDFLTSTAGVLAANGLVTSKDVDSLRLALSGINSTADARERPLLLELDRQKSELLAVIAARFGSIGLGLNLVRHTLATQAAEAFQILNDFGTALLGKAELLFNRPFYIYRAGKCQKQTLYSTVIIDFSETIARACQQVALGHARLLEMNPNDMAGSDASDMAIDWAIAQSLGFRSLLEHSLPIHAESDIKRDIAQALISVADAALALAEQVAANSATEAAYTVVIACDSLRAEALRATLLELPHTEILMTWEVRRRSLAAAFSGMNAALQHVVRSTLQSFSQEKVIVPARLPDAARRRVIFDMVAAGVGPLKAEAAANDLFRYFEEQNLAPRDVLPAELTKINPHLMPRSLDTLVALSGDRSLMTLSAAEKATSRTRAARLTQAFQATLGAPSLLLVMALSLLFTGCGLKARPQSDVVEYRPDIAFHARPSNPVDDKAKAHQNRVSPQIPGTAVGQPDPSTMKGQTDGQQERPK